MFPGFHPWRLDVAWDASRDAPIRLLIDQLSFTRDGVNWGYRFRFGLFEITAGDAAVIAGAMIPASAAVA